MVDNEDLCEEIRAQIDSHFEWLLVRSSGRTFPLTRDEIDVRTEAGRVIFASFDDSGFGIARVISMQNDGCEILLDVSRPLVSTNEIIRLIPRTRARELSRHIELARMIRANQIAAALITAYPFFKLVRVTISIENGRIANIIARDPRGKEIALQADVTATMVHEAVMTSAVIWGSKLRRRKTPITDVWIVGERKQTRSLQKLVGVFNLAAAERTRLFEISNEGETTKLKEVERRPPASLWREKPKKINLPPKVEPSETAERILALAPGKTDVIFSGKGETIRFHGLPFARTRTVPGGERAWFGTDRNRRLLTRSTWPELERLVGDLETYRNSHAPNLRHELYRTASEAWLESILRRNIRLLDANLILSPIYNQFRASADKIDLLAIRRDGRLVIIELKTSPDRETVFQAADYWRKVELQRRRGELERIRAFGNMQILDRPALVYVVAPALSFHRDFGLFASMLTPELELWRFELREDWRSEIKVLRRVDS